MFQGLTNRVFYYETKIINKVDLFWKSQNQQSTMTTKNKKKKSSFDR